MTQTITIRRTVGFSAIRNGDLMNNPELPTLKVNSRYSRANYIMMLSRNLVKVSLHRVIIKKVCENL